MRRRLPILACALAALTIPGCAGMPFANLFTFNQKAGGNVGASDALGARMMNAQNRPPSNKTSGRALPPKYPSVPATTTASAPE